ncbi:outer membrane protein assembly factor BamD [Pelistega sp. NLN82]|uniref:Outer membrane protein assembly factor BamD n=1 Tax=Pelistega ratti TaxID=2652177 RepID=A0A6L9Y4Q4_9BURK|nr:outer membrane protein assembly factor BamD [Pelistega ratti]NEN75452.1 outer membrane protein assembly factor BamD [Pelistega ratti]
MKRLYRSSLIILSTAIIAACGTFGKDVDETKDWTATQLYDAARESVRGSEWKSARRYLAAVESRNPYSSYAQQALIDLAYVNWKDNEPEQATTVINRFLSLYPNHPGTDYMLYLKGMVTFTPPSAFLSSYTGQDPSERDPKGLRQSYAAFKELVERYPESRYANDARQRLIWLVSTIADNEANVAQYYYSRQAYIAAINRSQTILREFSGVQAAERALFIMMKSYEALDMPDQATDAKRILDQNFPDSKYYKYGLEGPRSWTDWFSPRSWFR